MIRSLDLRRFGTLALAFSACLSAHGVVAQTAGINALDKVRLHVLNWSPVEEAVRDWPAISGEYRVDANGFLTVPFIEPIDTAGLTTAEVAGAIATKLRERFALSEAPVATVDSVDVPTVVVGGLVSKPGTVEYRPGMTVRHAIALAGGLDATLRPGTAVFRDYVISQGQARILDDRRRRSLAMLARLEAERNDVDEIVRPAALESSDNDVLVAEEGEILKRRRERLTSDVEALGEQIALFQAEVDALDSKVAATGRQRDLARETLDNARTLAERGLTRNDRLLDAERFLISAENQLLDTSTAILKARQAISVAMRERETLISGRRADVIQQILDTRADIAETEAQIDTTERLLLTDADQIAALRSDSGEPRTPKPRIVLYHARPDTPDMSATLDTVLLGGDLVDVSFETGPVVGMEPGRGAQFGLN